MAPTLAYIGIGSNVDPGSHLPSGIERLATRLTLLQISPVYRSAALNLPDAPDFLNAVVSVTTEMPLTSLKAWLREVEAAEGRIRGPDRFAPRTLDLDILLWGETVIDADITIRPFIAVPLFDLQPDLVLPGGGPALKLVVAALDCSGLVLDADMTNGLRALLKG
jgi:2-amino-4-hydroxy-6-hydroxymethyldihydropteridine diphosphokinase